VFPNKPTYVWVLWYGLVRVVDFLVHSCQSLDRHIVDVGDGDMRDFSLQDEGDVVVEDQYGIGPTHWEGNESECAKGGLEGGVVSGGLCY
jgi:hypothetical protein